MKRNLSVYVLLRIACLHGVLRSVNALQHGHIGPNFCEWKKDEVDFLPPWKGEKLPTSWENIKQANCFAPSSTADWMFDCQTRWNETASYRLACGENDNKVMFETKRFLEENANKEITFIGDSTAHVHAMALRCQIAGYIYATSANISEEFSISALSYSGAWYKVHGGGPFQLFIPRYNFTLKTMRFNDVKKDVDILLNALRLHNTSDVYILHNHEHHFHRGSFDTLEEYRLLLVAYYDYWKKVSSVFKSMSHKPRVLIRTPQPNHFYAYDSDSAGSQSEKMCNFWPSLLPSVGTVVSNNSILQRLDGNFTRSLWRSLFHGWLSVSTFLTNFPNVEVLDIWPIDFSRRDFHRSNYPTPPVDCLHDCNPGTPYVWNAILQDILSGEDKFPKYNIQSSPHKYLMQTASLLENVFSVGYYTDNEMISDEMLRLTPVFREKLIYDIFGHSLTHGTRMRGRVKLV